MSNPFDGSGTGGTTTEDIRRREQELMRREAELETREKELLKREQGGPGYIPAPNFPPCKPAVYHDIRKEIPPEHQSMVRAAFINWIVYSFSLIWNFFGICVYQDIKFNFTNIFLAAIWFILGSPIGFSQSYMSLYKGVKKNSTTSIFWFIATWTITTLISMLMLLGWPESGSTGLVMLFEAADKDKGFAVFVSGISVGFWGITTMMCLYVTKRVWVFYQTRGGNAAAKKEVRREVAQEVAKAAVEEAKTSV
eukprot:TRINITY_DN1931_c0_g1_i1.p1 TRINITY_DN1931_c0_g1~~TRINITY_DN1931_c0_g1_i1.p1  ORF type:complete len:252 (-),score=62.39 TRINITY_DN1931_c0_g1_i1:306-1061(-)